MKTQSLSPQSQQVLRDLCDRFDQFKKRKLQTIDSEPRITIDEKRSA